MIIALWECLKPLLPKSLRPAVRLVYRWYMRSYCRYVGLWDRREITRRGLEHLPSASLRYRVHGSPHIDGFLDVGKRCARDVQRALNIAGYKLENCGKILDFGCGCGRTMLWLQDLTAGSQLYGTDIDGEAIGWCESHLPQGTFGVNGHEPPLAYPDEYFDLILGITVFTQIGEDNHRRWIQELGRIVRPDGIILVTIRGETCWRTLDAEEIEQLEKEGSLFRVTGYMKGIYPEWYQAAYHTKEYIQREYGKCFEILEYLEAELDNSQDIVLLRKK